MVDMFCQDRDKNRSVQVLFDGWIIPGMCSYLMEGCLELPDFFHAVVVKKKPI